MGITEEHPCIPMATDQCDLRHTQAKFKETTNGLVSKVVEMKVGYSAAVDSSRLEGHYLTLRGCRG
jgi:hypothetical protein